LRAGQTGLQLQARRCRALLGLLQRLLQHLQAALGGRSSLLGGGRRVASLLRLGFQLLPAVGVQRCKVSAGGQADGEHLQV
jgi:hypothetical protein